MLEDIVLELFTSKLESPADISLPIDIDGQVGRIRVRARAGARVRARAGLGLGSGQG